MKKFDALKTVQLVVFVVLTAACALFVFRSKTLFHTIGIDPAVRLLCILLWIALGLAFLFIFLDYSFFNKFKHDFRELDFAVHSDPVAGIANRYSSDMIIEKYLDKPLPEGIGCIMLELTSLFEVNREHGHAKGNEQIKEFSSILKLASLNICHIGRNGGNKFLALFEDCSQQKLDDFLERLARKVNNINEQQGHIRISYSYGVAFDEDSSVTTITDLIALSNRRIEGNM